MKNTKADVQEFNEEKDSGDVDYKPYMNEVQKKIKSNWKSPKIKESKRIKAFFMISSLGDVTDLDITSSSGISEVDLAALEAIRNSAPFPPPPFSSRDKLDISFTFDYNANFESDLKKSLIKHVSAPDEIDFPSSLVGIPFAFDYLPGTATPDPASPRKELPLLDDKTIQSLKCLTPVRAW